MSIFMDQRGIDVALLYQRDRFKLLDYEYIRVSPLKDFRPTRDILHVSLILPMPPPNEDDILKACSGVKPYISANAPTTL